MRRIAAALAVTGLFLAPAATASAGVPHDRSMLSADVTYSNLVLNKQHGHNGDNGVFIAMRMKVKTVKYPVDYHAEILLKKWPAMGPEAHIYGGHSLKNIHDLATTGDSVNWAFFRSCVKGRFYFEIVTSGISADGKYQQFNIYYPPGQKNGKEDKYLPPDRKHSHKIVNCD